MPYTTKTPEHEKLPPPEVRHELNRIFELLDQKGYRLCDYVDYEDFGGSGGEYKPVRSGFGTVMNEAYDVDEWGLEEERREMLANLKAYQAGEEQEDTAESDLRDLARDLRSRPDPYDDDYEGKEYAYEMVADELDELISKHFSPTDP